MHDNNPQYDSKSLPLTLEAFKNRPSALPPANENYIPPTPQEVAQLIRLAGWSQNDTAKLMGVSWSSEKGSSTIRKWKADKTADVKNRIPYTAWRLMLGLAGVIELDDDLKAIGKYMNLR